MPANGRRDLIRRLKVKSAGASVQSTAGSRGVRISGSNAGYTKFRGIVKSTGYPLHSPVSPFTSPPVRHRVPSLFNWTLTNMQSTPVRSYTPHTYSAAYSVEMYEVRSCSIALLSILLHRILFRFG